MGLTGLLGRGDTLGRAGVQALAAGDTAVAQQYEERVGTGSANVGGYSYDRAFPRFGQNGFVGGQALSLSYYDDYDFDNDGQPDVAYDASLDSQFPAGSAPVVDGRTRGLVTRTMTRVLGVAENDPSQAAWLTTTTFYDAQARPIQVQSTNARRGTELLTSQLDFAGQVVQSVSRHAGPHHAPLLVREFFRYDHAGRLLSTRQQLPGEARPALLDSIQYNELGQVLRKVMGTGRLRQQVDYTYNIRGWLTSLNNPFATGDGKLFTLSLHYATGFTAGYEQYNGNLTGQTWRGRDGVQRAYGYVYDPLNRLLQGDYVARTPGTAVGGNDWRGEADRYRLSFVSYDDNGNLLTLRRRGLLTGATRLAPARFGPVDALTYAYQGNRLQAVEDAVSTNELARAAGYHGAPRSLAGDFQEQGVHQGQEYFYDANGNTTQDRNKGITGIAYNHLNLPRRIHFGAGADSVVFRYAASGQKVAKLVYQSGQPLQRTDYLGPYQYEGDSLRFFPHAEGRVLRSVDALSGAVAYTREFSFKDHLGNLRLAYRLGQRRTYTAGLEPALHARESQQFDSLSVSAPIASLVGSTLARTGSYAARLNAGGDAPRPLGPTLQLGVQQGDTVSVTAHGLYPQAVRSNFWFSLATFVTNLLHPANASATGPDPRRGRAGLPLLQVGVAAGLTTLPQLSTGVPKGYVRVLVFNADSVLVGQQVQALSSAALDNYERLRLRVVVPQDGYVTAYVGNESDVDVYFDDVSVELRQGLQVQENQYDPFGLDLAGVSSATPGLRMKNFYQFNGKENQLDFGLNWNHQDWRFFDYQIGRWHAVDPAIENDQESWTPYSFSYDNPIKYADADGRQGVPAPNTNPAADLRALGKAIVDYSVKIWNTPVSSGAANGITQAANMGDAKTIGDVVVGAAIRYGQGVQYFNDLRSRSGLLPRGEQRATSTELKAGGDGDGDFANANHPVPNVNPTGGKENCVNCAIAMDATLAGKPASSLPGVPQKLSVLKKEYGNEFTHGLSPQGVRNAIPNHRQRGIVAGIPKPGQTAHVFNAVNQNGVVNFVDGQIGAKADLSRYIKLSFLPTTK